MEVLEAHKVHADTGTLKCDNPAKIWNEKKINGWF